MSNSTMNDTDNVLEIIEQKRLECHEILNLTSSLPAREYYSPYKAITTGHYNTVVLENNDLVIQLWRGTQNLNDVHSQMRKQFSQQINKIILIYY